MPPASPVSTMKASCVLDRDFIKPIATYFAQSMTTAPCVGGTELDHGCISAFQMATDALIALGWAKTIPRGAVLLSQPISPEIMPRWDDICAIALKVSDQRMTLRFHEPKITNCTIRPAFGFMGASAEPETYNVLQLLNLVHDNQWTSRAETLLWRNVPYECPVDFSSDYRFKAVVDHAIATMPADIEAQIRDLTADPSDLMNMHKLNWLFFEKWRLGDGWLLDDSGGKPLAVFHDNLALSVSAEVVRRLCP